MKRVIFGQREKETIRVHELPSYPYLLAKKKHGWPGLYTLRYTTVGYVWLSAHNAHSRWTVPVDTIREAVAEMRDRFEIWHFETAEEMWKHIVKNVWESE